MAASCKCVNGHEFSTRVIEDSPDINYFEVEDACCPECGATDFEVTEVSYDDMYDFGEL